MKNIIEFVNILDNIAI